jgi:hypothetical protein
MQVAADGPHHHLTGIQPNPNLDGHAFASLHLSSILLHRRLHGKGGVARPYRMVLMRQWRPE